MQAKDKVTPPTLWKMPVGFVESAKYPAQKGPLPVGRPVGIRNGSA